MSFPTLEEQVKNRCKHFTGIMDNACRANVIYKDVQDKNVQSVLRSYPCLFKEITTCPKREYKTDQEVAADLKSMAEISTFAFGVIDLVRGKPPGTSGTCQCPVCKGSVLYSIAPNNGHIRARCNGCQCSFIE